MSCVSLYSKNQFCFEFSYLLGVTGTFIAVLTPEFNDFDGWVNELLSIMASEVELLHLNNSIDFMNKVSILRSKLSIEIK